MTNLTPLALPVLAGILLGILFFGGLWWTVRRNISSNWLGLWLLGSLLLRTAIVLAGFYLVSQGDWRRLLACLPGFLVGRLFVTRATRLHRMHGVRP